MNGCLGRRWVLLLLDDCLASRGCPWPQNLDHYPKYRDKHRSPNDLQAAHMSENCYVYLLKYWTLTPCHHETLHLHSPYCSQKISQFLLLQLPILDHQHWLVHHQGLSSMHQKRSLPSLLGTCYTKQSIGWIHLYSLVLMHKGANMTRYKLPLLDFSHIVMHSSP